MTFQLGLGETIILVRRRHIIDLLPVSVSALVLVIAAALVSYLAGRYPSVIPGGVGAIVALVLAGIAICLWLLGWWVYRQNQLVLTNQHVIKLEQDGLFGQRVSQLSLSRVQDVNGSRHGLAATIFNFGRIEIQTAGEQEEFIFTTMPSPMALARLLVKAHDDYLDTHGQSDPLGSDDSKAAPPAPAPTPTVVAVPPPVATSPPLAEELPAAVPPAPIPSIPLAKPSQGTPLAENESVEL